MNKRLGASIIFVNDSQQVLLFLRDDKPGLPYRNMWDILGGHVEKGETPFNCIIREMKEEIGIDLKDFMLLSEKEFDDRIEFTYWKKANLNIPEIILTEGQYLKWFTREEVKNCKLAYGFNDIVEEFYQTKNIN